jgi:hypothetical protein
MTPIISKKWVDGENGPHGKSRLYQLLATSYESMILLKGVC